MSLDRVSAPRALAALSLLAAPAVGQGQVWVVDDVAGAGVDFTSLQAAVDAASDGDLVLVKAGDYSGLTIDAKALTVIADAGAAVGTQGFVRVEHLAAGQSVALRGLGSPGMAPPGKFALQAASNAGPLWIEDCRTVTAGFPVYASIAITSSSSVAILRCTAVPIVSTTITFLAQSSTSLVATDSNVHCFDSHFQGTAIPMVPQPEHGLGARVANGLLFASGSTIRGGSFPPCGGVSSSCDFFNGKAGLVLEPGGHFEQQLGSFVFGGQGTPGGPCFSATGGPSNCPVGSSGPGTVFAGGTQHVIFQPPRSFQVGSPIRAGQSATLTTQGLSGEVVFALYSFLQQHTFLPDQGTLLLPLGLGTETGLLLLGPTGPTGSLVKSIPIAQFPPGFDYLQLYLQAAFVTPLQTVGLAGGSLLVVLNQSF